MRRGSNYRQRPSHPTGGRMKERRTVPHYLDRVVTVEDKLRTVLKTLADFNARLNKLEAKH